MTREQLISARLARIYQDPWVFLKFCAFTNDAAAVPPVPKSPFPVHLPYVRPLVDAYRTEPMIVIEKGRQLCVSWTFAALFAWEIMTKPNIMGLVFSQNQQKTIEFGQRVKFILDNIPESLWPSSVRPEHRVTQEMCVIDSMNSKLMFMTSAPDVGHGYTPTFTFFDEFAYHPWAEESYRAIMGGAVRETSRIYFVSTPCPVIGSEEHKFYQLCDDTVGSAA